MPELRPYQQDAVNAAHEFICTRDGSPCIVCPTAAGKSWIIAGLLRKWFADAPWLRANILAHRKELLVQNHEKLGLAAPDIPCGIFSAALQQRDYESPILFASIDSVYKKAGEFPPWDVIVVDEAHHIPPKNEGKYRSYIEQCRPFNPKLKVIGLTATPYRMASGPICHKDHVLTNICYEIGIVELIQQGYLCPPRSKVGEAQPDLGNVLANNKGDYILKSLSAATNKAELVDAAIREAISIIERENRKHCLFFCVDVDHAALVSSALRKHGWYAPFITGKTSQENRDKILRDFNSGYLRGVCSIQVLTEGYDAPHIDCIVLLRPTLSKGLYYQMIGRGLRLHPDKQDCLCLDMAGLIDEHGPIDLLSDGQYTALATCLDCRESFSRATRVCPSCGWEIPKIEIERLEQVERERRMHSIKASNKSILSNEPMTFPVDAIYIARHCKEGSPDSVRVQYRSGMAVYREWVLLDHPGPEGDKAQRWWTERFGRSKSRITVKDALENLFATSTLLDYTKTITVRKDGKWWSIIGYNQNDQP